MALEIKFLTQRFLKNNPYVSFIKTLCTFLFIGIIILAFILTMLKVNQGSHLNKEGVLGALSVVFGIIVSFCYVCLTISFGLSLLLKKVVNTKFFFWLKGKEFTLQDYLLNVGLITLAASIALGIIAGYLYANY